LKEKKKGGAVVNNSSMPGNKLKKPRLIEQIPVEPHQALVK
jgi:hypothetical protein